jgi:hypothetical protein
MTPEERWQVAEDIGLLTQKEALTLACDHVVPDEEPTPIPVELGPGETLDFTPEMGERYSYPSLLGPGMFGAIRLGEIPDYILVAIIRHRGGFAGFPKKPVPRKQGDSVGEGGLKVNMRIADLFGHWWDVTGINGIDVTVVGPSGRATVLHKERIEADCTLAEDFPRRTK